MVLHTIIGEYDILYAQEREFAGYGGEAVPQAVLSTNPMDFLGETALSKIVGADSISAPSADNPLQRAHNFRPYRNDLQNINK